MIIVAFNIWAPILIVSIAFGVAIALIPGISTAQSGTQAQQAALGFAIIALALLFVLPWAVYAIWMALRYSLAVPACVVESMKARNAIRRSVELSKGSRGRIFLLGLLVFVIELGLVGLSQFFIFILAFKHHGHVGPVAQAISQVIAFFTNTFLGPIYATGLTLFYYDQRVRKEGFDIEWMMQAAGLTVPQIPPVDFSDPPPAAEQA